MVDARPVRRPSRRWFAVVVALALSSVVAAVSLTRVIDQREAARFDAAAEEFERDIEARFEGFGLISGILPLAFSPDIGGISLETLELVLGGGGSEAAPLRGMIDAFPLDGYVGFAIVPSDEAVPASVLSEVPGVTNEVLEDPAIAAAIDDARTRGGSRTSAPVPMGERTIYANAVAIGTVPPVVAVTLVDVVAVIAGGAEDPLAAQLDVAVVDAGTESVVVGVLPSLDGGLARSFSDVLLGRRLRVAVVPSEGFGLQSGALAGSSLLAMGLAIAVLAYAVGVMSRRRAAQAAERLQMAQQINEDKDRFIAGVSHELRTPLTAILGLSQQIAEHPEHFDPAELAELSAMVARQSEEMSVLIEDLLVAARADAGTITILQERVDLAEQARVVCKGFPEERSVLAVDGTEVWCEADPLRVRQIVRNLVANAIRHGGPTIEVHARGSAEGAVLEVRDDGDGIEAEARELIFAPYYRSGAAAGLAPSVGLGLSVARQLAELMGGTLDYRYDNGSSVFRLVLPTAARAAA